MNTARLALVLALVSGCGGATSVPQPPAPPPASSTPPQVSTPTDPLGPRPVPATPVAYVPPEPRVLDGPGRSKVWLLERHNLPLVTVAVVVPYGSALEPAEQGGLAFAAADMLDEGAGDRDALAFSQAVNDLGAHLASSADRDASVVSVQMLAAKLEPALALMADAITRPRDDAKDWTRVQALWVNGLKNRAHDPNEVARVATSALFYGDHPYAHPPEGTINSAQHVALKDIVAWQKRIWRPDVATFVVVGDVTVDKVTAALGKAFAGWKTPTTLPMAPSVEPYLVRPKGVRTFVVDRADAPQIVMSLVSPGPRASDPVYARLAMLNIGLGGSFTSRLNQNLREEHGWTYGARSRFNAQRGPGMFVVRAAIKSDSIAPALREARKEVDHMAKDGVTDAEVEKLRALVNGDALDAYGTVHGTSASLATNATLGLGPDQDVKDLASQRSATAKELSALASKYLDLSSSLVVLVGPKDLAVKALADNGLPSPEFVDGDGKPVASAKAAPSNDRRRAEGRAE